MPIVERRIEDAAATPWSAASFCMRQYRGAVLFDDQTGSATREGRSLLMCEPRRWLVEQGGQFIEQPAGEVVDDPVDWTRRAHQPRTADSEVLFAGGIAGFWGFEFGWQLDAPGGEMPRSDPPELWVGEFEAGAVFDHGDGSWTVGGRQRGCVDRLVDAIRAAGGQPRPGGGRGRRCSKRDVSPDVYRQRVAGAVEAIEAGELFEVNYTERFHGRWSGDRRVLYDRLRARAPGTFGGLIDADKVFIASVSPEQFLRVEADGTVVTRPIKGTRPRGATPEEDRRFAEELVDSAKDRAENIMIVDLMRNDITRVCEPGTVRASKLCELHSFESVHHLVSTVEGRLDEGFDALDAFAAAFPAGSITGAPKLRSMEWIARHEHTARGPYTGSMFYWSDQGWFDSNVLIRTAVLDGERAAYGSGGAVVSDSNPAHEYEEALWKARPFLELMEEGDDNAR